MFALIEQLSQELFANQIPLAAGNSTTTNAATPSIATFADVAKFVASFSIARDWIKLFVLGSVLETIRRFASTAWTGLLGSFFLTATFESDDDAYNWMMVWIAKQPVWKKARDIQISTKVRLPSSPTRHHLTDKTRPGVGYRLQRLLSKGHPRTRRGRGGTREASAPIPSFNR
jgi:hypothetical protein